MPTYVYKCSLCKQTFEKRHGMFFLLDQCDLCHGRDCVFMIPSLPKNLNINKKKKVGQVVKEYIEDAKKEIKKEKNKMKSEEK